MLFVYQPVRYKKADRHKLQAPELRGLIRLEAVFRLRGLYQKGKSAASQAD